LKVCILCEYAPLYWVQLKTSTPKHAPLNIRTTNVCNHGVHIQGAFKKKSTISKHMNMVKLIEKCILLLILTYSLLLQTHFLQHSRHIWNGLAKLSFIRVLVTTYHLFFFLVKGQGRACQLSLQQEKRKNSAEAMPWG
jgi:hypothetical protein